MSETYFTAERTALAEKVQKKMSAKRFSHVLGVEEAALALATRYGVSPEKASIAALVHDYAKERSDADFTEEIKNGAFDSDLLNYGNAIWHGLVGAEFVKRELGITDEEILNAVRLHTTGGQEMTLLDKIIYVADYIEAGRDFPGVEEARMIAKKDLDQAVAYETQHTLLHLIEKQQLIYPKTIATYNRYVAGMLPN